MATFLALLGLASGGTAPPAFATHDGNHPQPSAPTCEWYGSVVREYHIPRHQTAEDGSTWERRHRFSGWSRPSHDSTCRGSVQYSWSEHYTYPDGWWHREGNGTVSATYNASLTAEGYFVATFAGDEYMTLAYTDSSGNGGTEEYPVTAEGSCAVPGAETEAKRARMQAVVITCSQMNYESQVPGEYETATIRMRRTNCDKTVDSDGDDLADCTEFAVQTDPTNPDTDGDGLTDGKEVLRHGTDPRNPDTDGGGVRDGDEIARGTNPRDRSDDPPPDDDRPECMDGQENDLDGKVDFPADKGCSSLSDPDEGYCNGGNRGYTTRDYRGKIPGFDLFEFSPAVRYRVTDSCAEIVQANTWGKAEFNFATVLLGSLGFTGRYDEDNKRFGVKVTKRDIGGGHDFVNPPTATLSGDFDVRFDWATFVVGGGLKAVKLADRPVFRRLARRIQRKVDATLDDICNRGIERDLCFEQLSAQQALKLWRHAYGRLTGMKVGYFLALEDALATFVAKPGPTRPLRKAIARAIHRTVGFVFDHLNMPAIPKALLDGKVRAREYGKVAVEGLLIIVTKEISKIANHSFSIWSPDVTVTVLPGGTVTYRLDGYANPFLATEVVPGSETHIR